MTRKTAITPDQFRADLNRQGKTITQWAAEHGYTFRDVSRVLNGVLKARHGRAHEIAVALGLKVPGDQPSTPASDRNMQARAAA